LRNQLIFLLLYSVLPGVYFKPTVLSCPQNSSIDGFLKSPSAALRGNLVVAAPKGPHSSILAGLASGAFYETIIPVTSYKIIIKALLKNRRVTGKY
jgi:hypothetical protein